MCGIAGRVRFREEEKGYPELFQMTESIRSRGPDRSGYWINHRVAFGHTRLKIIDLSESAAQPMIDRQLGLSIVYNGEIYNYQELRQQLQQKGYQFYSSSDTEVILKSYDCWGAECLQKFNGMFAFVIYSFQSGNVFVARDRLGIKPLYYAQVKDDFYFASSLDALLPVPGLNTSINPKALQYYMTFHSVVPAPETILAGVKKLEPGYYISIDRDGAQQKKCYWRADFSRHEERRGWSEQDWQEAVMQSLRISVKRRLVADVPVGVFLSGGLDSSLITAFFREQHAGRLSTFSVGFNHAGGEQGNEFKYSDLVAERFATDHHRIDISTEELLTQLPNCIAAMSEPMVSHDNIGFFLLSKYASQHLKVVQSGQGADEVFGGYGWYPPLLGMQGSGYESYKKYFFDHNFSELQKILNIELTEDVVGQFVRPYFSSRPGSEALDHALKLDTEVMLVDDPVKRVDNMTMAWGLEARVPFLDHELVELVASMPPQMKVRGDSNGKYILKQIGYNCLPHEVIDRPKGYFPVPELKYVSGRVLEFTKQVLTDEAVKKRGLFDSEYIRRLLNHPEDYITPLGGSKLWQIATLEFWLQQRGL